MTDDERGALEAKFQLTTGLTIADLEAVLFARAAIRARPVKDPGRRWWWCKVCGVRMHTHGQPTCCGAAMEGVQ